MRKIVTSNFQNWLRIALVYRKTMQSSSPWKSSSKLKSFSFMDRAAASMSPSRIPKALWPFLLRSRLILEPSKQIFSSKSMILAILFKRPILSSGLSSFSRHQSESSASCTRSTYNSSEPICSLMSLNSLEDLGCLRISTMMLVSSNNLETVSLLSLERPSPRIHASHVLQGRVALGLRNRQGQLDTVPLSRASLLEEILGYDNSHGVADPSNLT